MEQPAQHDQGKSGVPSDTHSRFLDAAGSFFQCDRERRVGDSYEHLAYRIESIGRGSPNLKQCGTGHWADQAGIREVGWAKLLPA